MGFVGRRRMVIGLGILMLASALVLPVAEAGGTETGVFPHRIFYVARASGDAASRATYVTTVQAPMQGRWWVRLEALAGSSLSVQVSHDEAGTTVVDAMVKLRRVGQESPQVSLQAGVLHRVSFTAQGHPGTSVLSEQSWFPQPPTACFSFYPPLPSTSSNVHFDASCSWDPDGDIAAYLWDFGDGTTATGSYVDHGFRPSGAYNVTLKVVDAWGNEALTSRTVNVIPDSTQLVPPHHDYAVDEDGDGLYDALVVEVRVGVAERDWFADYWGRYFRVQGTIQLGNRTIYEETSALLSPGLQTMKLRFDGVAFRVAGMPGPYEVRLTLIHAPTGLNLGDGVHETAPYDPMAFEESPAHLEPPHTDVAVDSDGDGYFDYLQVDVGVRVIRPVDLTLYAWLYSGDRFAFLGSGSSSRHFETGWTSVQFIFPGPPINASRWDGPLRLELGLFAPDIGIYLDQLTLPTQDYRATDFKGPPASFWPPHADRGVDADGDGLFETLEIEVGLVVIEPGTYSLHGSLGASLAGNTTIYLTSVDTWVTVDVGRQVVTLRFSGEPINGTAIDGPYTIALFLSGSSGPYSDEDSYVTGFYRARDFKGVVASLAPGASDRGVDTDGDGFYNHLAIEIPIQVNIPSDFEVIAWMMQPCCQGQSVYSVTHLEVGLQRVTVTFDGVYLRARHLDGPYTIRYWLYDNRTHRELGQGDYTTTGYSSTQFEQLPAALVPPPSEYGLDTDGDGRYNYLVVEATVEVVETDTFILDASLSIGWYQARVLYAYNISSLDPGTHRLQVRFDGVQINASRVDSVHTVTLTLWSMTHAVVLGGSQLQTRFYMHTEFEEPPFVLAPPHRDYGLDTDGDGLYNLLVVEVRVTALQEGSVWVQGVLSAAGGTLYASNLTWATAGDVTVSLAFMGWQLRSYGLNGPYSIRITLQAEAYGVLDVGFHSTQAYRASEFDPMIAIDASGTTDHGEDVDGDGLYDFVTIDVAVEVELPGPYAASAAVVFDNRTLVSGATKLYLESGRQVVPVRLSGMALRAAAQAGPYTVDVYVQDFYFGIRDHTQVTTSPYPLEALEPPTATIVPPFVEEPRDLDGDGLYDALVVTVTVEVLEARNYTLVGCLDVVPDSCRVYASKVGVLGVGNHTLKLEFPGEAIRGWGLDGPYVIGLALWPTVQGTVPPEWVVRTSFTTKAYDDLEFEYTIAFNNISDTPVDLNGNGRYEYLVVQVEILVGRAGSYMLDASLEAAPWSTLYAHVEIYLEPGTRVVNITFDGVQIYWAGRDGPYSVQLYLSAPGLFFSANYTTAAYRFFDFGA